MKKKKKTLCIVGALILSALLSSSMAAAKGDVIRNDKTGIPDKGLYRAILQHLKKKETDTFTKKEAAQIRNLNAEDHGIKDLKGIGYLKNLQYLNLSENKLTKLTGFKGLNQLEHLSVSENKFKNMRSVASALKNNKQLKSLYIVGNKLKNLNGIGALRNLVYLDAGVNRLTDISAVKKLSKLKFLDVGRNQLTKLPDLTKTRLKGGESSDFTYNRLSKKELKKRLPKRLIRRKWFEDQVVLQNIYEDIALDSPKSFDEITTETKTITGTAHKGGYVCITLDDGDREGIYFAHVDGKGKFELKNLPLEQYEGRELFMLSAYVCHEASHVDFAWKSFIVKKP